MSPEYYRKQASVCRKRASEAQSRELAVKWLEMAAECDQLADCFQMLPASSKETPRGALN